MGYYTYANSWFDPDAGTLKDVRGKLEKKGYNAIIDDNDKRSFMQSQAPLIVFDVMNNLGDVKISKLTTGEMRRNMIDWQNMKHTDMEEDMRYNELHHHGILGQKWGIRRYQNADGTLTAAGKRKYYGQQEDAIEYRHNKAGESGWKGLKRKLSAKKEELKKKKLSLQEELSKYGEEEDAIEYRYNKAGESGFKGLYQKMKNIESSRMNGKTNNYLQRKGQLKVSEINGIHAAKGRNFLT